MGKNYKYETLAGTTSFNPTIENSSCTGGTITDISFSPAQEDSQSTSYVLTYKDLKSCSGFEDVSLEQAEAIITSLYQLSKICYQSITHE